MKQIFQNGATGETEVQDVPVPRMGSGEVQIRSVASLVSAGTERMSIESGQSSLILKAWEQPKRVKDIFMQVRTDGISSLVDAVQRRLDEPPPRPLGYCNTGILSSVGTRVDKFAVGDRVVSNGKHGEVVVVPKNLCARIPDSVEDESAVFTVQGSIALQGVRLANPTLGEAVVVTGLGLIGLLTIQIARANGCRVLGIDLDPRRLALAKQFGADVVDLSKGEDPVEVAAAFSRGHGIDAVILTAATKSSKPVSQAAKMCRKRGRIVLVGVTGLDLSREDFYKKELSFQVSCSYGPGRYDPNYEARGQDYPLGFVRWTEQRNFEAVLELMASGKLRTKELISHRFDIDNAVEAYELLLSGQPSLGILIRYPARDTLDLSQPEVIHLSQPNSTSAGRGNVGFIGAGSYGSRILIPSFKKAGATLHTITSASGVSGFHHGKKFGFLNAASDTASLLSNPRIDTVAVCTRHDTHAQFVLAALRARKHVFVEKPLCLRLDELSEIASVYREISSWESSPILMVGFNRRFAPQVIRMKALLEETDEPKSFVMTVNAGPIPADHWTQDKEVGGGRILGEGCHFIDLLRHLAGTPILRHSAVALGHHPALPVTSDKATIILEFEDGSVGTIHYLANGDRRFPKERLEVFCAGRILQLDNFRSLNSWGWQGFSGMKLWRQDKGNEAAVRAFLEALRSGAPSPIPAEEIFEVSQASIQIAELLT